MSLDFVQIWLLIGAIFLGVEFLTPIPTVFIPGMLGFGAILTSIVVWILPIPIDIQVLIWLILSSALTWYSRRWLPRNSPGLIESSLGITTTEILAGQSGRVKYEGISWKAICDDPNLSIGANVPVQVVRKDGTTLIVLPENYVHKSDWIEPYSAGEGI